MAMDIDDQSFEQEVIKSDLPVVVDFWAPWCGPCRTMAPVVDKLSEEYKGKVKFCKLNVDDNRTMANKYQVMSIPMLLFFKKGEVVDQSLGAVSEKALKSKIQVLTG